MLYVSFKGRYKRILTRKSPLMRADSSNSLQCRLRCCLMVFTRDVSEYTREISKKRKRSLIFYRLHGRSEISCISRKAGELGLLIPVRRKRTSTQMPRAWLQRANQSAAFPFAGMGALTSNTHQRTKRGINYNQYF